MYELSEGDKIVIGVTSDRLARADREVLPYTARAENLSQYRYRGYGLKVRTTELTDGYSVTLDVEREVIYNCDTF